MFAPQAATAASGQVLAGPQLQIYRHDLSAWIASTFLTHTPHHAVTPIRLTDLASITLPPLPKDILGEEDVNSDFVGTLRSGVVLCRLAEAISAQEAADGIAAVPPPRFHGSVQTPLQAQDNMAAFAAWAQQLGCGMSLTPDALETPAGEAQLLTLLLQVARLQRAFYPPRLVELEQLVATDERVSDAEHLRLEAAIRQAMDKLPMHKSEKQVHRVSQHSYLIGGQGPWALSLFDMGADGQAVICLAAGRWITLEMLLCGGVPAALPAEDDAAAAAATDSAADSAVDGMITPRSGSSLTRQGVDSIRRRQLVTGYVAEKWIPFLFLVFILPNLILMIIIIIHGLNSCSHGHANNNIPSRSMSLHSLQDPAAAAALSPPNPVVDTEKDELQRSVFALEQK